jgi:hypothetical protein
MHEFGEGHSSLASRDADVKLCGREAGHRIALSRDDLHVHDHEIDRCAKRRRRLLGEQNGITVWRVADVYRRRLNLPAASLICGDE